MKDLYMTIYYCISQFIDNWIYPAHYLKNLLFYRYDRIKIPQIKPYQYTDKDYLMLCSNMEIIVNFIEKEHPEKYICWYKDDNGNDVGHKYGQNPNDKIFFEEYKDKYIMDIIKEIYHFWKNIYPKKIKQKEYLLDFWYKYLHGEIIDKKLENDNMYQVQFDKSKTIKTLKQLYSLKLNWDILDSYFQNKNDLLNQNVVRQVIHELENNLFNDCQKYLHLCIEVRPYLWT